MHKESLHFIRRRNIWYSARRRGSKQAGRQGQDERRLRYPAAGEIHVWGARHTHTPYVSTSILIPGFESTCTRSLGRRETSFDEIFKMNKLPEFYDGDVPGSNVFSNLAFSCPGTLLLALNSTPTLVVVISLYSSSFSRLSNPFHFLSLLFYFPILHGNMASPQHFETLHYYLSLGEPATLGLNNGESRLSSNR